jgi:hypothetical protein
VVEGCGISMLFPILLHIGVGMGSGGSGGSGARGGSGGSGG